MSEYIERLNRFESIKEVQDVPELNFYFDGAGYIPKEFPLSFRWLFNYRGDDFVTAEIDQMDRQQRALLDALFGNQSEYWFTRRGVNYGFLKRNTPVAELSNFSTVGRFSALFSLNQRLWGRLLSRDN